MPGYAKRTTNPGAPVLSSRVGRARRTGIRAAFTTAAVPVLVVMLATTAWAVWSALGTGTGVATTGTLAPPTGTTATSSPGTGTVTVSWAAPTTGVAPSGYKVARVPTTGSPVSVCGTGTTPVTGTSCSDTSVPDGTYTYVVTSIRGSWTAVGTASSSVAVTNTVGTTTTVASSANPSITGQTVTYTATVTQASGTTTPTGSVTFKDGTGTITCTGGNQALSSGTATCSLTYSSPGTHSITAVYAGAGIFTGSTSSTSPTLTQTVNAATATQFAVTPSPTSVTAGTSLSLTITAKLANGTTTDTAYAGTKSLTWSGAATSSSPNGATPTLPTTASFTNGVASVSVTLKSAGNNQALTVSDGSINGQATITINPATASAFSISPTASTVTAGGAFGMTLTAKDAYGNVDTSYAGTKAVAWTDGAGNSLNSPGGVAPTLTTNVTFSAGSATLTNQTLVLAGIGQTLKATALAVSGSTSMTVNAKPGTNVGFDSMKITKSGGTDVTPTWCALGCSVSGVGNGGKLSTKVSLVDVYGNPVKASGGSITVTLTVNAGAVAPSTTTLIINNGSSVSTGTVTMQEGTGSYNDTLTASASGLASSQATFSH